MCGCTTSLGPDRYGPVYNGRFVRHGARPASMPWLEKTDQDCPTCRVGAFAPGESLPPQPPTAPAGQVTAGYYSPMSSLLTATAYPVVPPFYRPSVPPFYRPGFYPGIYPSGQAQPTPSPTGSGSSLLMGLVMGVAAGYLLAAVTLSQGSHR